MTRTCRLTALVVALGLGVPAQAADIFDTVKDKLKLPKTNVMPKAIEEAIKPLKPVPPDVAKDRLCEKIDQTYTTTDSLARLATEEGLCRITKCQAGGIPTNDRELERWLTDMSERYVWIPAPFEASVGQAHVSTKEYKEVLVDRADGGAAELYAKVEAVLSTVQTKYPKPPNRLVVYIVESDQVNAQALPGGIIQVTRRAASDLDDEALELVIAHEVAHVTKRHLSKQFQTRLIETRQALNVFKQYANQPNLDPTRDTGVGLQVLQRMDCVFARYAREQEEQADACAARVLVGLDANPRDAFDEYLRVRGDSRPQATQSKPRGIGQCPVLLTAHPEDKERGVRLDRVANHYRNPDTASRNPR